MGVAASARAGPRQKWRTCDEGCHRVWSRSTAGSRSQVSSVSRTELYNEVASYRFGTPEPSLDILEQQLQEVSEEEEQLREELRELEHELAQACGADGEDYGHRKSRFKHRVDEAAANVRQLRHQRAQILEGTDPVVQEEQEKRDEIRKFKTSSGYSREEDIDQRIDELEQQMYDVSMELLQEKRVLAEIQSLQRQKEEVKAHRRVEETLRSDEEIIRSRLEDIGGQLKAKLRELQQANTELADLEEERQTTLANSPLVAERSRVHHRLNECVQMKTQLEGKVQGIYAREKAKEEQRRIEEEMRQRAEEEEERRRQAEEEEEERRRSVREERRAREERLRQERKRQQEEEQRHFLAQQATKVPQVAGLPELPKEPPGSAEMRLLEQTLLYCKKLLPKSDEVVEEKKPIEYNNPEGSVIIIPKEDRSEEYLFAPPKPRRHEGKIRKRPPTSKLKKTKEAQQVLLHSPLSFQLFEELRIVPPVNTSDVQPTIDEVEERLAKHRQAAQQWELKRQELMEQKLQNELEKVREAQEEREQERRRRLNMALMWLEEFENEARRNGEDGERDQSGLQDLVNAAKSMGATDEQLSSALQLLKRWKRLDAEAALIDAMNTVEELQTLDEPEHLQQAVKDLEKTMLTAKKASADSELLESAEDLLQAASREDTPEGESSPKGEEETEEVDQDDQLIKGQEESEEFVPTILNLDDDEELVFDLGM